MYPQQPGDDRAHLMQNADYDDRSGFGYSQQMPIPMNTMSPTPTPMHQPMGQQQAHTPMSQYSDPYNPNPYSSLPQPPIHQGNYGIQGSPVPLQHGLAPTRQPRRYKTVTQKVKLHDGKRFVLDCPVPKSYLNKDNVALRNDMEFTHMRYTAATCDPNDFQKEGYTLRPTLMNRSTELFIVLTMYNEDDVLFTRTMDSVVRNIAHLVKRDRSKTWGQDSWKKVVVCIVSDGRKKIHPRTLNVLKYLAVYQDLVAKSDVDGKPVTAHIYEYTTQISLSSDMKEKDVSSKQVVPCQILFCLKEQNQKKINSHRWFFNAFAPILQPKVCILIDVGTKPGHDSIYRLWKVFDIDKDVGGACGEIKTMTGTFGKYLLNPLVAAQNFEYKMSNILDKPLESMFGFISVLPGAFSAYRYKAIQNDINGVGPLEKYYLGETLHGQGGVFECNMYLAEDRILCYELVSKRNAKWMLYYTSRATGETDVPDSVPEFISQRRRWLNGSFFAGAYSLWHWRNVWRSDHSLIRKLVFMFEAIYNTFNLLFSWFGLGNFYLTFYILTTALGDDTLKQKPFSADVANILHIVLNYVYVILLIIQFIIALGNRPQGSKYIYIFCMGFFGLLMIYMMFATIWITVVGITTIVDDSSGNVIQMLEQSTFRNIIISLCSTYLLYFVGSLLFLDPWHMFTSFLQYIFLSPSYLNVLTIYAFCNIHDVSWGTKGDNTPSDLDAVKTKPGETTAEVNVLAQEDLEATYQRAQEEVMTPAPKEVQKSERTTEDKYRQFRTYVVLSWIISNLALVVAITNTGILADTLGNFSQRSSAYLGFILWSVAGLAAIRFLGAASYRAKQLFTKM